MTYQKRITQARAELAAAQKMIRAEIRDYPTPISGCDAQYTYLIGMADSIADALQTLEEPRFVATPRTLEAGAGVEIP